MTPEQEKLAGIRDDLLKILDEAMRVADAARGKIRVLDPDTGTLEVVAQRGFSDTFIETFHALDPNAPAPSARAARLRRRVTVPDVARVDGEDPFLAAAREEGIRAIQVTPLVGERGRVVGTLSTCFDRAYQGSVAAAIVLDYCAGRAATLIESALST